MPGKHKIYDEVLCEIGDAEHRSEADAIAAGEWIAVVAVSQPTALIRLMLGGYDEDPRELWDIPEAAAYIRQVALASGVLDWRSPIVKRFGETTVLLLAQCGALGPGHPFKITIRPDAPP